MDRRNRQIDRVGDGANPFDIRELFPLCDDHALSRPGCPKTPGTATGADRPDEHGNGGDTARPPRGMAVEDRCGITELEREGRRIHDGKLAEFRVATHR
jgi:hypothetical protein